MCLGWVRFLIQKDSKGEFYFSDLSSQTAQKLLLDPKRDTVVLWKEGKIHIKSEAAIELGKLIGGPWSLLAKSIGILPKQWRDWVYDRIASHRDFGHSCELLPIEQKWRFLA